MRTALMSGLVAGVVLGGAIGVGIASSEDGEQQPSSNVQTLDQKLETQLKAANQRSQAAIRLSKDLQNRAGRFLQPENLLIGAQPPPPPIRQLRGTGDGGFPSQVIKDGAIINSKLGNESVDSAKIAQGGVTAGDLADGSVSESKIVGSAVTGSKVASGAVSAEKLDPDAASGLAYFAYVTPEGILQGNRGFLSVTKPPATIGIYELTTAFPVTKETCPAQVTVEDSTNAIGYYGKYAVTGTNEIEVRIYRETAGLTNEPFGLTVHCVAT